MLSHVCVGTNDFPRALAFYAPLMAALDLPQKFCDPSRPWAAWMPREAQRPLFVLGAPFDGMAASPGNGQMVALLAPDRATVDRCHALALAHGGRCEGPPGLRPHYHADFYGAYMRDPDGNKLCVCCHQPA
ncbi:VOC family protein [Pseudomonas otitidis]|uniref:VOC family protein n=1 Tax=Metapseudomonas otitidis TaxID=319939 RepID=UPI002448C278|nr:VOC family protein [Pseudomonas otitidis]MDH1109602.1 VOC family protein [Pseudomonas otitidis]MDH1159220.1 VOC family protein [Pseudomonas otitidis]MDH1162873.1 VOC family protein [Pseudomonas otitidis]